jgi:uncharacterized protein YaiE (UPF0345 family)
LQCITNNKNILNSKKKFKKIQKTKNGGRATIGQMRVAKTMVGVGLATPMRVIWSALNMTKQPCGDHIG